MEVYYAAVGRRPFSPYGAPPPASGPAYGVPPRAAPLPQQKQHNARPKNGQARSSVSTRAAPTGPNKGSTPQSSATAAGGGGPVFTVASAPAAGAGAAGWLPWGAKQAAPKQPAAYALGLSAVEREQNDRAELFHKVPESVPRSAFPLHAPQTRLHAPPSHERRLRRRLATC